MKLITLARFIQEQCNSHSNSLFHDFCQIKEESFFEDLHSLPHLLECWRQISDSYMTTIENELVHETKNGIVTCLPQNAEYPRSFKDLQQPVWCFQYLGRPVWQEQQGLAVVGSREPSWESLQWMEEVLTKALRELRLPVISGGARGVDQKAHSLALRSGLSTVVVLPSGLRAMYPKSLEPWCEYLLASGGALISEYRSTQTMHKSHFISRNRLIPALSLITLIVEARLKSGTMITAKYSADIGKPLLVMPTHPLDPRGRGGLDLIFEGATPLRDALDLVQIVNSERGALGLVINTGAHH